MKDQVRRLAIALLDNSDGITIFQYNHLRILMEEVGGCLDIVQLVETCNDHVFLPENWKEMTTLKLAAQKKG